MRGVHPASLLQVLPPSSALPPAASHIHSNPLLLFRDKVRKPVEVFVHQKSAR